MRPALFAGAARERCSGGRGVGAEAHELVEGRDAKGGGGLRAARIETGLRRPARDHHPVSAGVAIMQPIMPTAVRQWARTDTAWHGCLHQRASRRRGGFWR